MSTNTRNEETAIENFPVKSVGVIYAHEVWEPTRADLIQEFNWDSLWGNRTWWGILKRFGCVLLLLLIPSSYDTITDVLLFIDFQWGQTYTVTVPSKTLRELTRKLNETTPTEPIREHSNEFDKISAIYTTVDAGNMSDIEYKSDCILVGFYTDVDISTGAKSVASYVFSCFETDPYYSYATLAFILLPGLVVWRKLSFLDIPTTSRLSKGWKYITLLIPFPVLLLSVEVVALVNSGGCWSSLSELLLECEGTFESSLQLIVQIFIIFSRADRYPSDLQMITMSASFLLVMKTNLVGFLQPRRNQKIPTMKEKVWKAFTLLPMTFTNSFFKLVSIALVCTLMRYVALGIYFVLTLSVFLHVKSDHVKSEKLLESIVGMTCLPISYSEDDQKKQLRYHNKIWVVLNSGLLLVLVIIANISPDVWLFSMSSLPIIKEVHLFNYCAAAAWSSGLISCLLIFFQETVGEYEEETSL